MFLKQTILLAALTVLSVVTQNPINPSVPIRGDVIRGQLTRNSVLIFGGPVTDTDFEWRGHNVITRFEILHRTINGTFQQTTNIRGGVDENFLQFWSIRGAIDAYVRIFSEPNNQQFGWPNEDSVLLNTTRITGVAPINDVLFGGAFFVRAVQVDDLTNGTGSSVTLSGLNGHTLTAHIQSLLFRGVVDYVFRLYGEPTTPNNAEHGQMNASSVLIHSQVITRANLSGWSQFQFHHENHTVDYVRLTDLTNGTGGRVSEINSREDYLVIQFENNFNLEFQLEVYGQPRPSSDIILGEMQPGSVLLVEQWVREWGRRATAVLQTDHPIDRIEVIDQNRRSRVRASVTGEIGGKYVAIVFESDETTSIQFVVRLFGRRQ